MRKVSTPRSNGHASAADKPNGKPATAGKDVASAHRGRSAQADRSAKAGRAASVDANGRSVASAAASSAAAGADHGAYAEAARAPNGKLKKKKGRNGSPQDSDRPENVSQVPPGLRPLPENGAEFIDALHAGADFAKVGMRLLNSRDEKIVKAVWERLLDIKYGESTASDEPTQIIFARARPADD